MKNLFAASLIATALAAGLAEAGSDVLAAGQPVRSLFGECWRAGPGSDLAADACTPTRMELAKRPLYETAVFFESDRAELGDEGRKALDHLARKLLQAELVGVVATARADRLGGSHYNAMLSARRAEAIRAYLVEQGVPESVVQLDARAVVPGGTGLARDSGKEIPCATPF